MIGKQGWIQPYSEQLLHECAKLESDVTLITGVRNASRQAKLIGQLFEETPQLGRFFSFKYLAVVSDWDFSQLITHDLEFAIRKNTKHQNTYIVLVSGTLEQWKAACQDDTFSLVKQDLQSKGWL